MSDETRASVRILLTVLGTKPSTATYSLGGNNVEAQLAPLALIRLLPQVRRPDVVMALCTKEAKGESWPLLQSGLDGVCRAVPVDVTSDKSEEDIDTYLGQVANAIPAHQPVELIVDVTHGLRHLSFLTYVAALYLSAWRGVKLDGAYYGLLSRDGPSPFFDLQPLLELPRWFHAIQVLDETGSALPMAKLLSEDRDDRTALGMAKELSQLSEAYLSALPLELGQISARFLEQRLKPLRRLLRDQHRLPLANELTNRVSDVLRGFALSTVSSEGKQKVTLSQDELARQSRIIDDLLNRDMLATALGLMNEWTVSWAIWLEGGTAWLDFHQTRRRAASLLGALAELSKSAEDASYLTPDQRVLGEFWGRLTELRNAFHHHGMRPQLLTGQKDLDDRVGQIRTFWSQRLRHIPRLALRPSTTGGRVLVSPIGRRPGVLLSAVQACRDRGPAEPDRCMVICSEDSRGNIDGALSRAAWKGHVELLHLEDPYGGRAELDRLTRIARAELVGRDEVLVNITGGTTLMGLLAEAIAVQARDLACPVYRFGLIDKRPSDVQESDPYQIGEAFWLTPQERSW
ncbi:MAG: CRISPR-associated DxTHG motif protein [Candidatus Xenobia bacterium]